MKEKGKAFSIQWYPKDILSSARVAMMDLKEEGAYRRALDFCWLNGFIPSNPKEISKLIGKGCTVKIAEVIKTMFYENPQDATQLFHERLEKERIKQQEYSKKQSEAGRKGNIVRWGGDENATQEISQGDKKEVAENRSPTPSPTPITNIISSSSSDAVENLKIGPSSVLVQSFPTQHLHKAKAFGMPHEEIEKELKEFDAHHLDFQFADDKHILNSWGIWCKNYQDKRLNPKKQNNFKNNQSVEAVKPKFNESQPADKYF